MASRTLKVEIIGDASSLQRALKGASSSSSSFGSKLAKVGRVAAIGLGALGAGAIFAGKKMKDLASDAAEVDSKLDVVFGKALPQLSKNLDAFSEATGASRFALREQAADLGALLAPLTATKKGAADMSEQFVKLATDLGSFNNVPVEDALLAIRSGLVGEAEPLRRFGVLLNEAAVKAEAYSSGIAKTGAELTEQQKVQARANLIMEQTKLAQGDATRTAGSMANQLKTLKNNVIDMATSLGTLLIPATLSAVKAFNENWPAIEKVITVVMEAAVGAVSAAVDAIQRNFETIKRVAVASFDGARSAISAFVNFIRSDLGRELATSAVGMLAVGRAIAVIVPAVKAASAAFTLMGKSIGASLVVTGPLIALGALVGQLAGNFIQAKIDAANLAAAFDRAGASARELKDSLDALKQANLSVEQAHLNQEKAVVRVQQAQKAVNAAYREFGPNSEQASAAVLELRDALLAHEQSTLDVTTATKNQTQAEHERTNKMREATTEILKLADAGSKAADGFRNTEVVEKFSAGMRKAGLESQVAALKLRDVDPAASKAAAKAALLADVALDLTEKLGRVPKREEIIAEAKARNFPEFYRSLLELQQKIDKGKADAAAGGWQLGLNFGQGVAAGIAAAKVQAILAAARLVIETIAAARAAADAHSDSRKMIALGRDLVGGLITGVSQKEKEVRAKLKSLMSPAVLAEIGAAAQQLGAGTVREIIAGFVGKAPDAKAELKKLLRDAVEAARQEVVNARAAFADAFGSLFDAGIAAIEAKYAGWQPPSLLKAQREAEAREKQELLNSIKSTQTELQALIAQSAQASQQLQLLGLRPADLGPGATEEEQRLRAEEQKRWDDLKAIIDQNGPQIVAKQKELNDLLFQQRQAKLQADAAAEQKAHDAEVEREKEKFRKRLLNLKNWAAEHPKEHRRLLKKIEALWEEFGIKAEGWGKALGDNIAKGLNDAAQAIIEAATALGKALTDYQKGKSPTKKGPLSKWDPKEEGYARVASYAQGMRAAMPLINRAWSGAGVARVSAPLVNHAGVGGAAMAMPGGVNVTVHVHGPVTSERDLALAIRNNLTRRGHSNGGDIFGGQA